MGETDLLVCIEQLVHTSLNLCRIVPALTFFAFSDLSFEPLDLVGVLLEQDLIGYHDAAFRFRLDHLCASRETQRRQRLCRLRQVGRDSDDDGDARVA